MKDGSIIEDGTPAELDQRPDGIFRSMRAAQEVKDPGVNEAHATAVATDELSVALPAAASSGASSGPATPKHEAAASADKAQQVNVRARIWAYQKDRWYMFILGGLGSLAAGSLGPINSVVYGGVIAIFYEPDSDLMVREALKYFGYFVVLGALAFCGVICKLSVFSYLGEHLTRKLRNESFGAILRQPAAFFDNKDNGVGTLTSRLAADAAVVRGATGESLGTIIEGCGSIIAAIAIAFSQSWRLALVLLSVFPLLIFGAVFEFRNVAHFQRRDKAIPGGVADYR
jgi:ABC-type multidrug transport system fused ATPase/permease subunit